jgi:RNA polymerase sigma-70 factor (ECF subfamily)
MADAETSVHAGDADRRRSAWMAAAQAGDRTSYERLLHDCIPVIKMIAGRQGVPPDRIDDVVQETLLTVHRARQTYDPRRSFTAWLTTIAQRRAIDALRSHGRQRSAQVDVALALEHHADPRPDPAAHVEAAARAATLGKAIATLPTGQREAVEHRALREQSLAEASAVTGRSTGALKVNLHRALRTLRARLAGEGLP